MKNNTASCLLTISNKCYIINLVMITWVFCGITIRYCIITPKCLITICVTSDYYEVEDCVEPVTMVSYFGKVSFGDADTKWDKAAYSKLVLA